jgi:hypothetical protein
MRVQTHTVARLNCIELFGLERPGPDGMSVDEEELAHRVAYFLDSDRFLCSPEKADQNAWTFGHPAIAKLLYLRFFNRSSKIGVLDPYFINGINAEVILSVSLCLHHALMCYASGKYCKEYKFGDKFTAGNVNIIPFLA